MCNFVVEAMWHKQMWLSWRKEDVTGQDLKQTVSSIFSMLALEAWQMQLQ